MEVSVSTSPAEVLAPTFTDVRIILHEHPATGELTFTVSEEGWYVFDLYELKDKLYRAYEGKPLTLLGRLREDYFVITSIIEGRTELTPNDFELFCLAMEIPYRSQLYT